MDKKYETKNEINQEEKENLEEKYTSTREYIDHNKDHINKESLKNIKEKQANRELQRRQLEWK